MPGAPVTESGPMTAPLSLRALALPAALALAACAAPRAATVPAPPAPGLSPGSIEMLAGVLWVQTSAEYRALSEQAYAAAEAALARALADSGWTAALEQTGDYAARPPAVILDIDETALDNSPYQARLVLGNAEFESDTWTAWIDEAAAPAVPGAVEFARAAAARGVAVFYVSNRDSIHEPGTRRNLERVGFPLPATPDVVLLRGERGWTSDKTGRRAAVAAEHRVLLVIGDDVNDFANARLPLAERDALVRRHADRWGERWIVLPNPMYGSWLGAAIGPGEDLSDADVLTRKLQALDPEGASGP